jgi:hypothetical protein
VDQRKRLPALAWVALILISVTGVFAGRAAAVAGTHPTLANFQAHIRGDALIDNMNGTVGSLPTYSSGAAPGYAFTIDSTNGCGLIRTPNISMASLCTSNSMRITMTGRPVTAFGATMRIMNGSYASVGGTLMIATNSGESFQIPVPGAGTFFGFTTTQPFTSLTIETVPAGSQYEEIDDVYVGTSGAIVQQADQCVDASTVGLGSCYFDTTNAIRDLNNSSCNTETTSPDVYFRFVAPATGLVTVSTCGCTFDSILRVFGSCGGVQVACNDDACFSTTGNNTASMLQFRITGGTAVIVRIAGYSANSGSGMLTITETPDCGADANHTGALEVADIFAFLDMWFAGCP